MCLEEGQYQFSIYDWCNDFDGHYNVTSYGELIVEGAEFGYNEITSFSLEFGYNKTTSFSLPFSPASMQKVHIRMVCRYSRNDSDG
mmetsp:Transcript_9499/g.14323  ORF Transcript_9499/g.14323 Transcript_9499/m.14323 type:complete len:86 (+) Transcript_9499:1-258(+)